MTDSKDSKSDKGSKAKLDCDNIQPLLTDYMSHELGDSQSALIREHVRNCEKCQLSIRDIQETLDLLKVASGVSQDVPSRLSDRRRARIHRAFAHPAIAWIEMHHFFVSIFVAATLVIGVLATLLAISVLCSEEVYEEIEVSLVPLRPEDELDALPLRPDLDPPALPDAPEPELELEPLEPIPVPLPGVPEEQPIPDHIIVHHDPALDELIDELRPDEPEPEIQPSITKPEPEVPAMPKPASDINTSRWFGALLLALASITFFYIAYRIKKRSNAEADVDAGIIDEGPPPLE